MAPLHPHAPWSKYLVEERFQYWDAPADNSCFYHVVRWHLRRTGRTHITSNGLDFHVTSADDVRLLVFNFVVSPEYRV